MSEFLSAFHLLRPWWLLLLLPAVALWRLERRAGETMAGWAGAIDPGLLRLLTVGGGPARRVRAGDALLLGWVIGIAALAGPTWRVEPSPFAAAARPAMLVLKVTPSMASTDLAPTRLDRAREKIADLLTLREGAPTGLVAYSGSAHLVLPPTTDANVLRQMAAALSPQIMPRDGDLLADAVALADQVLRDGREGGAVVVFADTVAPDQTGPLRTQHEAPVVLFAMAPYARGPDPSVRAAADALGAAAAGVAGEGRRWQEAGYWLTPVVALLVLGWFRRGWLLA